MDAGSNFDLNLVLKERPTVFGRALFLLVIKALTLISATRIPEKFKPNRLPLVNSIQISVLLAGGGEFAFVVLALAEKLNLIPQDEITLLTAIVLVTMGVTPLLGDLAASLSASFAKAEINGSSTSKKKEISSIEPDSKTAAAEDSIVVLGHSETGRAVLQVLDDLRPQLGPANPSVPDIVTFSRNPDLVDLILIPAPGSVVLYGDGNNPEVIRSSGTSIIQNEC